MISYPNQAWCCIATTLLVVTAVSALWVNLSRKAVHHPPSLPPPFSSDRWNRIEHDAISELSNQDIVGSQAGVDSSQGLCPLITKNQPQCEGTSFRTHRGKKRRLPTLVSYRVVIALT